MLKNKTVKLKVSRKTITHYRKLGYDCNINEYIDIKITDLQKGSHVKVDVICDVCGTEKVIMYQKYVKNINNQDIYCCSSKCAQFKVKSTSSKNMEFNITHKQMINTC